jgi:two-component system response regulator FixJ
MSKGKIFIVDDDNDFRESLRDLLDVSGFEAVAFESALRFLDEAKDVDATCVIADIRMPGMDGLELQEELKARGSRLPVIIMTGHGDVPLAVRAMRAGAVDFLEKPFDLPILLESIERAGKHDRSGSAKTEEAREAVERIAALTDREREVLDLLVAGHQNKVIAFKLDISPRTVEVHRSRVMEKTGSRSLPDLVHLCIAARRTEQP